MKRERYHRVWGISIGPVWGLHRISGACSSALGTVAIVAGMLFRHPGWRAFGYRRRVIGSLEKRHDVDRRTLTAFLDRWAQG